MDLELLSNASPTVQVWAALGASALGAVAVRYTWRRVLPILTSKTKTTIDEHIAARTAAPVAAGVLLFGLWRSALLARGHGFVDEARLQGLQQFLGVATIYAVAFVTNGALQGIFQWYGEEIAPKTETQLDDDFLPIIRQLALVVVIFIATAMALQELGKDITALVATASVASLAVALAAQDTLANMIASIMIMVDRPFRVGDRIEFRDGKVGDVLEIGMRSTRILSLDNHVLVVPNKDLANERIINHKVLNPRARLVQDFGVAYDSDIAKVKSLVLDIVRYTEHVEPQPAPQVLLLEFGDSALQFQLLCWVDHYKVLLTTKDAINTAVKATFDRHGITIPFPQQEVRVVGLPNSESIREAAAGKEKVW